MTRLHCLLASVLMIRTAAVLPWLRVAMREGGGMNVTQRLIVDEYGRAVTLRGANFEQEERNLPPPLGLQRPIDPAAYANGQCVPNHAEYQEPPICEIGAGSGRFNQSYDDFSLNDLASARAAGLNIIRLCLSWSQLESQPGVYNSTYIERVAQIVSWAREQGIYVILDMHEDAYSTFIQAGNTTSYPPLLVASDGQDGAPDWAVLTHGFPPLAVLGVSDLNLAVMRAFTAFWDNEVPSVPQGAAPGPGLQDHCIGAIAALAARFANDSTVAGIEIINEPTSGLDIDPWDFSAKYLYPFYQRVIQALTGERDGLPTCPASAPTGTGCAYPDLGIHTQHMFFVEPNAWRNQFDLDPAAHVPFTNWTNIVYSPHVYTDSFTILPPPSFTYAYETATSEADGLGAALFITEFGGGLDILMQRVAPTADAQDAFMCGGTSWSWKSNCAGAGCVNSSWTMFTPSASNGTGIIAQTGPIRPEFVAVLSRVQVRAAAGQLLSYGYNSSTGSFVGHVGAAWPFNSAAIATELAGCAGVNMSIATANACADRLEATAGAVNLTEVYIPRHLPSAPVLTNGGIIQGIVIWPDASRSVYMTGSDTGGGGAFKVCVGLSQAACNAAQPSTPDVTRDELRDSYTQQVEQAVRARVQQACEIGSVVEPRMATYCASSLETLMTRRVR